VRFRCILIASTLVLAVGPLTGADRRVDHGKFPALKGPFKDGPSVTKACLSCHDQSAQELMATSHWTWKGQDTVVPGSDGKTRRIGKANLINNFCIGIQSNEASCTACHIGYGWKDKTFNFNDASRIDCLVCHDTTGEYTRKPIADEPLNWTALAQAVGPTSVQTCGSCHFAGGGGEGVKHGDLDPSLLDGDKILDLHMAPDGLAFTCSTCHRGDDVAHNIRGRSASVSVRTGDRLSCATCHGESPHGRAFIYRTEAERRAGDKLRAGRPPIPAAEANRLNWHARRIACQTCHIPRVAKSMPTKTWWDWSTAGRLHGGKPYKDLDENGDIVYMSEKGDFKWTKDLAPEYRWYNGTQRRYLLGDVFDPSRLLALNPPQGSAAEPDAKIWPFKIMRGKQPYDVVNRILVQPKLSGKKGSGAFWEDFQWDKSVRVGMAYVGMGYSGTLGFAETEMYWPLGHMAVEGSAALSCRDCHARNGRLARLPGVYIPGQHRNRWLDFFGWIAFYAALAGVLLHAGLRWRGRRTSAAGEGK